jgi:hypothetical protein
LLAFLLALPVSFLLMDTQEDAEMILEKLDKLEERLYEVSHWQSQNEFQ